VTRDLHIAHVAPGTERRDDLQPSPLKPLHQASHGRVAHLFQLMERSLVNPQQSHKGSLVQPLHSPRGLASQARSKRDATRTIRTRKRRAMVRACKWSSASETCRTLFGGSTMRCAPIVRHWAAAQLGRRDAARRAARDAVIYGTRLAVDAAGGL